MLKIRINQVKLALLCCIFILAVPYVWHFLQPDNEWLAHVAIIVPYIALALACFALAMISLIQSSEKRLKRRFDHQAQFTQENPNVG